MVERPQLKASDGSMTAHSASPRATPPFPFPREKLKKGFDSFRSTGPVWSLVIGIWLLSVSCAGIFTPPASRMAKPIGISWNLAFWPAEGLRLATRQTSPSQIAHFSLDSIARKWQFLLDPKWLTGRMQKPAMVR